MEHAQPIDASSAAKARINTAIGRGTAVIMAVFFVAALFSGSDLVAFYVISALLLVSLVTWAMNNRGYVAEASLAYLGGYTVLMIAAMFLIPGVIGIAPYFLGVAVMLGGILIRPTAPFLLALVGALATTAATNYQMNSGVVVTWVGNALVPSAFLFLLAIVAWLYGSETENMLLNLRRLTTETRESINILGASSSEILAVTAQVVSRTAETAAAISETTATADEVRQAADLSANKAKYVSDNSQRSIQIGAAGKRSMDETLVVMERIYAQMGTIANSIVRLSEQSQAIGEIIASVGDLAEQSNLLAVNAAIEAAKAGEHGRGFAVVAQEVRSLAEQSKQSTAQVRTILNDIQKATSSAVMSTEQGERAVEAGLRQSREAGEAIRQLVEVMTETAQAATQIAASSQEQFVGMNQVAQAMENINLAGTHNAASTRQAEIIAQDLYTLGQRLKLLVEQYHV